MMSILLDRNHQSGRGREVSVYDDPTMSKKSFLGIYATNSGGWDNKKFQRGLGAHINEAITAFKDYYNGLDNKKQQNPTKNMTEDELSAWRIRQYYKNL